MYERTGELIRDKFKEYLLPTILTSMAVSMASVVDGAIVGNLLGDMALAAVGLAGPVIFCINLIYMLFGIGGLTCASIARGKRENAQADLIFTLSIGGGLIVMLLFSISIQLVLAPISNSLAGGDMQLAALLESYLRPLVFTGPAMMFASGMALFIRIDGKPKSSSVVVIVANVVNLIFDYVLIRFLDAGIWGAGFSTTLGYIVGAVVVIPYLCSKKRNFHFAMPRIGCLRTLGNVLFTGLPKSLIQAANILRSLVLNGIIIGLLGPIGMSIMTVCLNVQMISNIFVGGVSDALLPIVGTLYGEGDNFGIRQTMKSALRVLAVSCAVLMAFLLIAPQVMGAAFGINTAEGILSLKPALRLFALYLPFDAIIQLMQNFFTTTKRRSLALAMVLLNGLGFILLFAFLFSKTIPGVFWLCYACSGAATVLTAFVVCKVIGRKEKINSVLLLKEESTGAIRYDITIEAPIEQASGLSEHIIELCKKHDCDLSIANKVGIAVEEMVVCTAHYAHNESKRGKIDVRLSFEKEKLDIHFRDNGTDFNPLEFEANLNDGCVTDGIELMKRLPCTIEYMRQLGFNSTHIQFLMK